MRYLAVPVTDGLEIHGPSCPEAGEGEIISAPNPFGAGVEYWRRQKLPSNAEHMALVRTYLFPCGAEAGTPVRTSRRGKLPFEPEAGDGEILTALMGKRIKWVSTTSGREEEARLYPDGPHEKVIQGRTTTPLPATSPQPQDRGHTRRPPGPGVPGHGGNRLPRGADRTDCKRALDATSVLR
ncbi:MAG: hypothetical protein IPK85_03155 [Gemmatimonadetes bacterium]|nr:hypothetical protein [Gemmatimonadota bacterium]